MVRGGHIFIAHGRDVLTHKRGGGRIALLGLPFFLAGLFVAQIPFAIILTQFEGNPIVLAIVLPLGPLFGAVGFVLMLSRSGSIIDRKNGLIIQWWGLLIPMKKKVYSLDTVTRVRVGYRAESRDSPEAFSILLVTGDSQPPIVLVDVSTEELAVKTAEELALFLGKPRENFSFITEPGERSP